MCLLEIQVAAVADATCSKMILTWRIPSGDDMCLCAGPGWSRVRLAPQLLASQASRIMNIASDGKEIRADSSPNPVAFLFNVNEVSRGVSDLYVRPFGERCC